MLELVADEPEPVVRLQVVARRRLAVARRAAGEEVRARVQDGRPRRRDACGEVERYDEAGKAEAAASSSSKSGTSVVS